MPAELTTTLTVRISDCDASGRWRPSAILVDMQEAAETHATSFGLSRTKLMDSGVVWILYRQQLVMHRYPTFGETIRMTTWPAAIEGPIFPRYFLLEDEEGKPVVEAATSWILMNIHTRRPMRPSALPEKVPANSERVAPLPLPGMLRVSDAQPLTERVVCYSDLDVNGHMNNTRYIDWVCDALDLDTLVRRGLLGFQINYISEGRPGETLALSARVEGDTTEFLGKGADGRTVFEASTTFGPER